MALLGRDTLITGPMPDGTLLLESFQGKETLGTPYRYDLTLLSTDHDIPVDKVLGQSLTVHIKLDTGDTRFFNGIVTYFGKVGLSMNHTRYVAVLNPKLTLFDYARDCRIFFGQDAPALATDVLSQRGFTDVESGALKVGLPQARVLRAVPRDRLQLHPAPARGRGNLLLLQARE